MLDKDIRAFIYATFAATGRSPSLATTAAHFQLAPPAVRDAYQRLAAAHEIVLESNRDYIWMAHPYSAQPTIYEMTIGDRTYWGNCAWDMLGIAAVQGRVGVGRAVCGCGECDERLEVKVNFIRPVRTDWIVHFLVPAAHFWDDIGHT